MVVADRPLLDVESNPAGSHLFLVSSKELLYTAMAGFFVFILLKKHPDRAKTFYWPATGDINDRFMFSAAVLFAIALLVNA